MCGRFTLRTSPQRIAQTFLTLVPELRPRYNIAPSQPVAAVRLDATRHERELVSFRWGLIPSWADDPKIGYRTINARAETVATKPSFRRAFQKRRCLIVADGFYEWKRNGRGKQPFFIHKRDDGPFAFAGLWESWRGGGGETIESCTLIVTSANPLMEPIHDRMPVILSPDEYDLWLDAEFENRAKLEEMLRPYPGDDLEAYPVSTLVNKPQNDAPQCVAPADTPAASP